MESVEIKNRVSESGLVTIDLEEFYPKDEIAVFDLKDFLFMGLIIKEKEFRAALPNANWQQYENKHVAITCSADAIIPMWAYMLAATYLQPVAKDIFYGDEKALFNHLFVEKLALLDAAAFNDKRVVIKGCGDLPIPEAAYVEVTKKLKPFVKSIMYGEPCSTVPVYKRKA